MSLEARNGAAGRVGGDLILPADHAWLVRLCTRLTGDAMAAEDLAQETLLEAWRHREKLLQPEGRKAWLFAIARNVCLRWTTSRQRESLRVLSPRHGDSDLVPEMLARVPDPLDLEGDLEHGELVALIDRALALLPPATRQVLVERYVHDAPQALVAARLGLSESAVEARLHRGKRALRRVLTTSLRQELTTLGLAGNVSDWDETRLWCPLCGRRHLRGQFDTARGLLSLRCPECYPTAGIYCTYEWPALLRGVRGYKPALGRVMRWANGYYRPALASGVAPCIICGRLLPVRREQAPVVVASLPAMRGEPGLHVCCEHCQAAGSMRLTNLILYLPEAWQFWRAHPRIQTLPHQEIEMQGRPALVTSLRSIDGAARLEVISARDSYEVLAIHDLGGG